MLEALTAVMPPQDERASGLVRSMRDDRRRARRGDLHRREQPMARPKVRPNFQNVAVDVILRFPHPSPVHEPALDVIGKITRQPCETVEAGRLPRNRTASFPGSTKEEGVAEQARLMDLASIRDAHHGRIDDTAGKAPPLALPFECHYAYDVGEKRKMPTRSRCERALFVLGDKRAGKTFQIRHMFKDKRLGRGGRVPPTGAGVRRVVWLSNERLLYLRAQAPQESGEDVDEFFEKIDDAIGRSNPRWNIVCPMRIKAGPYTPRGLKLVQQFINRYDPERVRVAILNPRQDGWMIDDLAKMHPTSPTLVDLVNEVRRLSGCPIVEPMIVDGRRTNGLLLPDFFDFT